ncbi:hypothetical protein [Xanthomonas sp. 1678]|uniref:hypothetical protein n=1 Tax=Xanthomonas sp. 1678 TaxID=3158788 RepID=UPI0028569CF2|nr:hypothetical protein [Xanthomonas translucens]
MSAAWRLAATLALALAWACLARAAEAAPSCEYLSAQAALHGTPLLPPWQAQVAAKGRSAFHRGPDLRCRERAIFVVQGDTLTAYVRWNDWLQVRYLARDGRDYLIWLPVARVRLLQPYPAAR